MKLQKMLYYAQGYHLALYGTPLFREPVEAWDHGPVVRDVWDEYKIHRGAALPIPEDVPVLAHDARDLVDNISDAFGIYSALGLRKLTHTEAPWRDAFAAGQNSEITQEVMGRFFRARLQATPPRRMSWAEALDNPRFKRAVDQGLSDIAAGHVSSWREVEQSLPT